MANWFVKYSGIIWFRKSYVSRCRNFLMIAHGITSCHGHSFVPLFLCSYHKLMVARYRNKWGKLQEAKWRSTEEWRPMCKLERVMDMDLFLEAQSKWAEDRPHCLVILHEMFLHAATEGQKEAEWVVC